MASDGLRILDRMFVVYTGDDYLHERCILSILSHDQICVVTPHMDVYVENTADYEAIYPSGPRQGLPARWLRAPRIGKHVKFDLAFLEANLPELLTAAEKEAKSTRGRIRNNGRYVDDVTIASVPRPTPKRRASGRAPVGAARPDAVVAVGASAVAAGSGDCWVSMEERCGFLPGQVVDTDTGTGHFISDRGTFVSSRGVLAIAKLGTWSVSASASDDLRTLPRVVNSVGRSMGTFLGSAGGVSTTEADDWSVEGPRTTEWLVQQHVDEQMPPTKRHLWWRNAMQLTPRHEGVAELGFLNEVLETSISRDALNIVELQCFELIARRMQLYERKYALALQEAHTRSSGVRSLEHEERNLFLGGGARGTALVCPALEKFVSVLLSEKSSLQKERRKAREERRGEPVRANQNQRGPGRKRGRGCDSDDAETPTQ